MGRDEKKAAVSVLANSAIDNSTADSTMEGLKALMKDVNREESAIMAKMMEMLSRDKHAGKGLDQEKNGLMDWMEKKKALPGGNKKDSR